MAADDGPRAGTTLEALAGLQPVFRENGTVTAGNACPLNDGAAALVDHERHEGGAAGAHPARPHPVDRRHRTQPRRSWASARSARAARRSSCAGLTIDDIDLVEINEAFAAQVIPSARELGIGWEKLNVHGGAIAVGHPFGMTGARITGTLLNGLRTTGGTLGLETMCVGGGQGMAMVIERLS